jgi:hypothetical protein
LAERITKPAIPALSAATAPSVPSRCTRRSTRGSTTCGRTSSRIPTTPIRSASDTKSAHRATSSRQVIPEEPTASVGGGGSTRTPNVNTPVPMCPSAETSRQRTVYASPTASPVTGARMTVPPRSCVTAPETLRPSAAKTTIASGGVVTAWS